MNKKRFILSGILIILIFVSYCYCGYANNLYDESTNIDNDVQKLVLQGIYNGMIDNHSIEIDINGHPTELRLTEKTKIYIEENKINEGENIVFGFFKNEYDQFILTYIEKSLK